jgi:lipoprotein signal peptidase
MSKNRITNFLPSKLFYILFPIILFVNYIISFLAESLEINGVKNSKPFGLNININYIYLIFTFTIITLLLFKILRKYPIPSAFILAGFAFNVLERLLKGHVYDFIKITWGFINLADISIWFGLLLLNYEMWFGESNDEISVNYKLNNLIDEKTYPKPEISLDKIEENKLNLVKTESKKKIGTVIDQIKKVKSDNKDTLIPKVEVEIKKPTKPKIIIT